MDLTTKSVIRRTHGRNWLTPEGRSSCWGRIQARMPSLKNARALTLTMDPKEFGGHEGSGVQSDEVCAKAYTAGKDRIRKFTYAWGKCLGVKLRYCWKLEVQANGMPHWHLVVLFFKRVDLKQMQSLWGFGNVDCMRIKGDSWQYLGKYLRKFAGQDAEGEAWEFGLPGWLLDWPKQVRFFQTSKGFLTPLSGPMEENNEAEEDEEEEVTKRPHKSIRKKLEDYHFSATVILRCGKRVYSSHRVPLLGSFVDFLVDLAFSALAQGGQFLGDSYQVIYNSLSVEILTRHTNHHESTPHCYLCPR